jgi:hypothetical protein
VIGEASDTCHHVVIMLGDTDTCQRRQVTEYAVSGKTPEMSYCFGSRK